MHGQSTKVPALLHVREPTLVHNPTAVLGLYCARLSSTDTKSIVLITFSSMI